MAKASRDRKDRPTDTGEVIRQMFKDPAFLREMKQMIKFSEGEDAPDEKFYVEEQYNYEKNRGGEKMLRTPGEVDTSAEENTSRNSVKTWVVAQILRRQAKNGFYNKFGREPQTTREHAALADSVIHHLKELGLNVEFPEREFRKSLPPETVDPSEAPDPRKASYREWGGGRVRPPNDKFGHYSDEQLNFFDDNYREQRRIFIDEMDKIPKTKEEINSIVDEVDKKMKERGLRPLSRSDSLEYERDMKGVGEMDLTPEENDAERRKYENLHGPLQIPGERRTSIEGDVIKAQYSPPQFSEGGSWAAQQRALLAGDKLRATQEKELRRRSYVKVLQDDITSMQETGKPTGKVMYSDVEDLYGKDAANHHQENLNHAAKYYAITSNFSRMPDDMIENQLNDLAELGKDSPAFLAAVSYADRLRKMRDADPAQAVADVPEVKAALQSNDKKALVQARLDAQRTLGIMQAPLTIREQQTMLAPLMQAAFQDRTSPPKPNTSSQSVLAIKQLREGLEAQYGPELADRILSSSLYASQRTMTREGVFGDVMRNFSQPKEQEEQPQREQRAPKASPQLKMPDVEGGTGKPTDGEQSSNAFEPHPMLGDLVPKATGNLMDNPYLASQTVDQLETDKVANMLGLMRPEANA